MQASCTELTLPMTSQFNHCGQEGGSGNVSTARESEFYAIEQSATCTNRISAMMMTFLNLCLA